MTQSIYKYINQRESDGALEKQMFGCLVFFCMKYDSNY